jgi:8-oxo-dGTP pyrophosphatase MutT (NUDIX family)
MSSKNLEWKESSRKAVFKTRIFSVCEVSTTSPRNVDKVYSAIESNDWAIIIPLIETEHGKEFVMIKQWRHGAGALGVEFPGGIVEKGEDIVESAKRELREETSYVAGKMTHLAAMNPNPAIMSNRVHFFLAEDLTKEDSQKLDQNEFIEFMRVPVDKVIEDMGKAPYMHALMAAALCHYLKRSS